MANLLFVLDSWPIMEWLKAREPTATKFDRLIDLAKSESVRLLISSMNLGEIYYNSCNVWGEARAEEVIADLDALPVHVFHPRQEDVLAAARLKARYKYSYADAFAVVLACEFHGPVVTGDPDFLKIRDAGTVGVEWWGA